MSRKERYGRGRLYIRAIETSRPPLCKTKSIGQLGSSIYLLWITFALYPDYLDLKGQAHLDHIKQKLHGTRDQLLDIALRQKGKVNLRKKILLIDW